MLKLIVSATSAVIESIRLELRRGEEEKKKRLIFTVPGSIELLLPSRERRLGRFSA